MARPLDPVWRRYAWNIIKRGPTELGYSAFRARRRRLNRGDADALTESDELAMSGAYDFTDADLAANAAILAAYEAVDEFEIRSIQWFVPFFAHPYLGGIHTIMRFADHLAREHGVESRFCVYDATPTAVKDIPERIAAAFPALAGCEVTTAFGDDMMGERFEHLRECDAAIGTLWTSAFPLLRFNRTQAKFYFVQDFEPHFYAASSAWALAEQTYRFGFPGIVNTPGLADAYREYGNAAVAFVPAVDTHRYHPPSEPRPRRPVRIFFYGRPFTPRNAFGLGIAALSQVKKRYGDDVEIVCAGENWSPGQFSVQGRIENLGRLPDMEAVADLYRSVHIGLVMMLTKHPSYQPFEFMASGVATVSNENPHTTWFLRDGENALLAPAVPSLIADRIGRLVEDEDLRERIVARGIEDVSGGNWSEQIEHVWGAITKQDAGLEPPLPSTALQRFAAPRG